MKDKWVNYELKQAAEFKKRIKLWKAIHPKAYDSFLESLVQLCEAKAAIFTTMAEERRAIRKHMDELPYSEHPHRIIRAEIKKMRAREKARKRVREINLPKKT